MVTYSYMGSGQLVSKFYNQPEIERTLASVSGNNPYAVLDRFGRLTDLKWFKDSKSGPVDLLRFEYGYDRISNRLFERNTILAGSPAVSPGVDSLLEYDSLNRLTQFETGVLNTGGTAISSPQSAQDWVLDETGNFIEFTQQNLQSGVLTTTLDQTRTHNAINEITGIDETVGASWATPAHDNSGNMTAIPQPKSLTANFTATWDAWNRLVSLSDGSNLVAQYEYDPVNRRIVVTNYDFSSEPETIEVRHRYHTTSWQVIEERVDSSEDAAQQFVWNIGYIDDLLLRDRDTNGDSSLDERLYALTDLRYSVMALANSSGTIVERYRYEAHGRSTALSADFAPRAESFYDWEYRYTGRELDLQTGLYYFRNRYFHSDLGRFITRDPLGYVDGMSLYLGYFSVAGNDFSGTRFTITYKPQEEVSGFPWSDARLIRAYGAASAYLSIQCSYCKRRIQWSTDITFVPWPSSIGSVEVPIPFSCEMDFEPIYDVVFGAEIKLDTRRIDNSTKHTRSGVYGHEQRHVISYQFEAIMALLELDNSFYRTKDECWAACNLAANSATSDWNKRHSQEMNHANTLSPAPFQDYPPIGVFPINPS